MVLKYFGTFCQYINLQTNIIINKQQQQQNLKCWIKSLRFFMKNNWQFIVPAVTQNTENSALPQA